MTKDAIIHLMSAEYGYSLTESQKEYVAQQLSSMLSNKSRKTIMVDDVIQLMNEAKD
jgi:hypothetical protein